MQGQELRRASDREDLAGGICFLVAHKPCWLPQAVHDLPPRIFDRDSGPSRLPSSRSTGANPILASQRMFIWLTSCAVISKPVPEVDQCTYEHGVTTAKIFGFT